jgi:hypothetical protein
MGIIGDKLIGDRPILRIVWQVALIFVMLFIMMFLFKTSCVDIYQQGYDDCQANFNQGFDIQELYDENGTLVNITVIPISPSLLDSGKADNMFPT